MPVVFGSVVKRVTPWDGRISNLKISAEAFPELYQALAPLQHKARSSRLRALALLGLHALHTSGNAPCASSEPSEPTADKTREARKMLKGKLLGSV
jgi:hypothetical protein